LGINKLPIGVQVYSIREEAEADFAAAMKQLKGMGYDGVELAGLYGMTPEAIRKCLDEVGLKAISAHVPYEAFAQDLTGTVKAYHEIGCSYLGIPYLTEERRYGGSKYQETLAFIPAIAAECRKYDMKLMYHNHNFEFEKTESGKYHLDELYDSIGGEAMDMQLDTCWVRVAGVDPAAYIERYRQHCPLVHIKDYKDEDGVKLVALGEGEMDLPAIARKSVECGVQWLIIEQDDHPYGSPMENMAKSIAYLKNIL